jgi:hypothetical protein
MSDFASTQPVARSQPAPAVANAALAIAIGSVILALVMPFFVKYFSKSGNTVYLSRAAYALKVGATGTATTGKIVDVTGDTLLTGALDVTDTITGADGIAITGATASSLASSSTSAAAIALTASAGGITLTPATAKGVVYGNRGTVTQATNITTGVTLNNPAGTITTQSATAGPGLQQSFTVTCSSCTAATSIVVPTLAAYAGTLTTNGIPIVSVTTVSSGSFVITVANAHASNSLAGALTINYMIFN